jgi:hypothetical protein
MEKYKRVTNSIIVYTNVGTYRYFWGGGQYNVIEVSCHYKVSSYDFIFSYEECELLKETNWMRLLESNAYIRFKQKHSSSIEYNGSNGARPLSIEEMPDASLPK